MSSNNGTLLNGFLRPKLPNNSSDFCSFTNFDFLVLHTALFDYIMNLPFLVLEIFESKLSVFYALYAIS